VSLLIRLFQNDSRVLVLRDYVGSGNHIASQSEVVSNVGGADIHVNVFDWAAAITISNVTVKDDILIAETTLGPATLAGAGIDMIFAHCTSATISIDKLRVLNSLAGNKGDQRNAYGTPLVCYSEIIAQVERAFFSAMCLALRQQRSVTLNSAETKVALVVGCPGLSIQWKLRVCVSGTRVLTLTTAMRSPEGCWPTLVLASARKRPL
jgi:hypothetical protein